MPAFAQKLLGWLASPLPADDPAGHAIAGDTLTASETQLVIEHGITSGGKTMREHNAGATA